MGEWEENGSRNLTGASKGTPSDKKCVTEIRGVATGSISVFIPPKSAQVNFLWGKNDVQTAVQQFYTPKKLLYPQKNLWLRPTEILGAEN